jgi:hypothetical protein
MQRWANRCKNWIFVFRQAALTRSECVLMIMVLWVVANDVGWYQVLHIKTGDLLHRPGAARFPTRPPHTPRGEESNRVGGGGGECAGTLVLIIVGNLWPNKTVQSNFEHCGVSMIFFIGEGVPIICKCQKRELLCLVTGRQRDIQFLCVSKSSCRVSLIVCLPCIVKGRGAVNKNK